MKVFTNTGQNSRLTNNGGKSSVEKKTHSFYLSFLLNRRLPTLLGKPAILKNLKNCPFPQS